MKNRGDKVEVKRILEDKKRFLDLLLLADEQEDMIDRYLDRGDLFALYDNKLRSICVVTKEDKDTYELKNLATYKNYQGMGYGSYLIKYILNYYKDKGKIMFVGTGDSQVTIGFYKHCGFKISHRIENFFIDNYDHEIFEDGVKLIDMVYLKKDL